MGLALTSLIALVSCLLVAPGLGAAGKPEDELVGAIKAILAKDSGNAWEGVGRITHVKWAPLPPTELQNCLPDGSCYTRQGAAVIGGRKLVVIAGGARTIVNNIYLRNVTAPFGEPAVLAALKGSAISAELARCPLKAGVGGTNWYRLNGPSIDPGILSIQTSCNGRPCEGFVVSQGEELPALQPNQLKLYSEQCSAAAEARQPVASILPHEALAKTIAVLVPQAASAPYTWKTIETLEPLIKLAGAGPAKADRTIFGDPNPMMQGGSLKYPGRNFSVTLSGSPTEVKMILFEEGGMHPRGEHLLGVVYKLGLQVRLVRCGPVYTESTNNWYSLTSTDTRPVMLRQSIRYEGAQAQESYELRLDGTLPKRDPRDRDPGVGGCR